MLMMMLLTHSLGSVYGRICTFFESRNYTHPQGSVDQIPRSSAFAVWNDMWDLRGIRPIGIIPSVIADLRMFHIDVGAMIVTDDMQLGQYSPYALGPTLIKLFPQGLDHVELGAAPHSATENPAN